MISKRIGDGRPYPEHGLGSGGWAKISPRQVHLGGPGTTETRDARVRQAAGP